MPSKPKYQELEEAYPNTVILQVRGGFYNSFGSSALALSGVTGFKVKISDKGSLRCGFPIGSKETVKERLERAAVDYKFFDSGILQENKSFGNGNRFSFHKERGEEYVQKRRDEQDKEPGRKEYDGSIPDSPFRIVEKCQIFASAVYIYTAKAEKEYRVSLCRKVQDLACEMIHAARAANQIDIMDASRMEAHKQALEHMERLNDLIPVMRRCKCISIGQESELSKQFANLRFGYNMWIENDTKRRQEYLKEKEIRDVRDPS